MNTEIIHPDSEKGKFVTELLEVIEGDYYNFQEMAGRIVDKLEEYADKFRQPDVIKPVCGHLHTTGGFFGGDKYIIKCKDCNEEL